MRRASKGLYRDTIALVIIGTTTEIGAEDQSAPVGRQLRYEDISKGNPGRLDGVDNWEIRKQLEVAYGSLYQRQTAVREAVSSLISRDPLARASDLIVPHAAEGLLSAGHS